VDVVLMMMCFSRNTWRSGIISVITMREAAEDRAGDEVRRQDRGVPAGFWEVAKSKDTTECTDSTSGVDSAARIRYARS
jgi:hypothetical protein